MTALITSATVAVVALLFLAALDDARIEVARPATRGRMRVTKPWPARQRRWSTGDETRVAGLYAWPVAPVVALPRRSRAVGRAA
jgi:hypothetical protein